MKRILMYSTGALFTSRQTGGIKRFVELAQYLHKRGAELCAPDDEAVLEANGLSAKYRFRVEDTVGLKRFLPPEARRVFANRELLRKIKAENYDTVISFDVPPTIGLCLCGVKNIVLMIRKDMMGYLDVSSERKGLKYHFKRWYMWASESVCLQRAKMIVVQCEYDKKQLLNRHKWIGPAIERKFRIQINNVNPSWVVSKSARSVAGERPTEQFRVCFVGNFNDNRKGHDILLEAAEHLLSRGCDIRFEIIGAGIAFEQYRLRYENKNIIFHGRLDNPMTVLKACDLMVVPSRADSCPNTVMESLYNGVAVIGSRVGGIPEILLDECAIFDLDSGSLESCIFELYDAPEKLLELKALQKKRKMELEFNWAERVAEIIGQA